MSLTPEQCRAARALLGWTQDELAARAELSRGTVRGFERGQHSLHRSTARALRQVFEEEGIVLLGPDESGGIGVRRAASLGSSGGNNG